MKLLQPAISHRSLWLSRESSLTRYQLFFFIHLQQELIMVVVGLCTRPAKGAQGISLEASSREERPLLHLRVRYETD